MTIAADRLGRKWFLVILSVLSAVGGIALILSPSLPPLAVMAFIGMLNGTGTDRSASFALDQAIVPGLVPDETRTWGLAWYNVLLDGGASLGALGAGLPLLLQHKLFLTLLTSYRFVFLGYSVLYFVVAAICLCLSSAIEVKNPGTIAPARTGVTPKSKRIVAKITALFSLDAFGGAAWLARHIGLVNTMVFTHLPSSLFLMPVPLAPLFKWAVVLFLYREALVEMDVPTRQSYVAAMVLPEERTFANGLTNLARNLFWAVGSSVAGLAM